VWIDDVHLQSGASSVYRRDFAKGTAVLNNTLSQVSVPLGRTYYRILGAQDPVNNNGQPETQVTLGPNSGIILLTTPPNYPADIPGDPGTGPPGLRFSARHNPVSANATFELQIESTAQVEVTLWAVSGRAVARLLQATLPAGRHTCAWDGRTAGGTRCGAGIYFARAVARINGRSVTRTARILLLR
jgi:hypothetical protein